MACDVTTLVDDQKPNIRLKKEDGIIIQVEPLYIQTLSDQQKIGLKVGKLLDQMNKTLGPFLFYLFALLLSNGTTMTYSQTKIIFANHAKSLVLVHFSGVASLAGLYFLILFRLCTTAQSVENAVKLLKDAFQDSFWKSKHKHIPIMKTEHDIMIKRLEQAAVLSPCSSFNINHRGYLSSLCIVSTYLIVLTQFKVSEVTY